MGLEDDLGSSIGAAMNPRVPDRARIAGIAEAYKTAIFFPRPEPGSPLDRLRRPQPRRRFPQLTRRKSVASSTGPRPPRLRRTRSSPSSTATESSSASAWSRTSSTRSSIPPSWRSRSTARWPRPAPPASSRATPAPSPRGPSATSARRRSPQQEVQGNPNITDPNSTIRGPGFVAPIGLGAHFPADVTYTPLVDLFAIEHTNRDSFSNPVQDNIKGTADDIDYLYRLNINPAFVPAGQTIVPPLAYGEQRYGSADLAQANNSSFQGRGIAHLPGGLGIYRDTDGNGLGDSLIAGIGVFFPGADGVTTFEQELVAGAGQTTLGRTSTPRRVLEAEYIAFAAARRQQPRAEVAGAAGAVIGDIARDSAGRRARPAVRPYRARRHQSGDLRTAAGGQRRPRPAEPWESRRGSRAERIQEVLGAGVHRARAVAWSGPHPPRRTGGSPTEPS